MAPGPQRQPPATTLESVVLDLLWRTPRPLSVREVLEGLDRPGTPYTTLASALDALTRRGTLLRQRGGRVWRYTPAAARPETTAETMLLALHDTTAPGAALLAFVGQIGDTDLAHLRELLHQHDEAGQDDDRT